MEEILEALVNQELLDKLGIERVDESSGKYRIKPLTPNISNESAVIFNSSHATTKKEELLTILNRLNQREWNLNNNYNWDVNTLHPDTEDTSSQETKASENAEENIESIIQSTRKYIAKLNRQLKELDNVEEQVENSTMNVLKDIDRTFQTLLDDMCRAINERREQLLLKTVIYERESLIPLKACRNIVKAQIKNAQSIVNASENVLQNPHQCDASGFDKLITASDFVSRIPTIPRFDELMCVTFNRPLSTCKKEIIEQISWLGCVARLKSIQVTVEERPGSVFVKWHVNDSEYTAEEQTFIVERTNEKKMFVIAYQGSETSCFIRDMKIGLSVTLRIRALADKQIIAESVHVAQTSIPPYIWNFDNDDYVSMNSKTAVKYKGAASTLFSHGPQFDANHTIIFKILQTPQLKDDYEGIALVCDPQGCNDSLRRTASLMITSCGKIFMDGQEKLMRLPEMNKGTHIVISALWKDAHVLRVNIESESKCVTYDWRVKMPLYFAARFNSRESENWILTVQ